MPIHGKRVQGPRSDGEALMTALGDIASDHEKREKERGRRYRKLLPEWLDRRILIGIAAVALIIIGDGVRRENGEFVAVLTGYSGQVSVQPSERETPGPVEMNQPLEDEMVVNTGPNSYATIEFADGSVTTLDQNTSFVIRLLEYSRGGRWRSRSFVLRMGRVWSRVGESFGEDSEMKVYTPSAVAAVRGTQYAVAYDPEAKTTTVQCNEGYVNVEGFAGRPMALNPGGQSRIAQGLPAQTPAWMPADARQAFAQTDLRKPIPPELWIKTAELAITQTLDAPLTILGIGKCSWGVGAADFARRTAAMEQLRRLMQLVEGHATYPAFVNPLTLEELATLSHDEALAILDAFHGRALLRYQCIGGGQSFRIVVRARDKRRTMLELTPTGISAVDE